MLWVLKRTVSMRWFLWAPKAYAKNNEQEYINNLTLKMLSKPVDHSAKDRIHQLVLVDRKFLHYLEHSLVDICG